MKSARTLGILAIGLTASGGAIYPDVSAPPFFQHMAMIGAGDPFVMEGTGTPIGPRHVLTAAHLGGTRVKVGNTVYMPANVIKHPSADIAVIEVQGTLPNWYAIFDAPYATLNLRRASLVGFGYTGLLRSDGSGYNIDNTTNSVLRRCFNVIGAHGSFTVGSRTSWSMLWDLDGPGYPDRLGDGLAIEGEGSVAIGDSGGGMFVEHHGLWHLVGVIKFTFSALSGNSSTFTGGGGATEIHAYREWLTNVMPPKPGSAGTVTLQQFSGNVASVPLRVEVRTVGGTTPLEVHVVQPDSAGNYQFHTYRTGHHDLVVKASHWLSSRLANVNLLETGATGLNVSLRNGDVNGDNVVNVADFLALRAAFGSSNGSGNWNPNADLNGDGSVNVTDFLILRSNFGQSGQG